MERETVQVDKIVLEDVIFNLKSIRDRMKIVFGICDLDIDTVSHGHAVQDGVRGILRFPGNLLVDVIGDLEKFKEAYPEGGAV